MRLIDTIALLCQTDLGYDQLHKIHRIVQIFVYLKVVGFCCCCCFPHTNVVSLRSGTFTFLWKEWDFVKGICPTEQEIDTLRSEAEPTYAKCVPAFCILQMSWRVKKKTKKTSFHLLRIGSQIRLHTKNICLCHELENYMWHPFQPLYCPSPYTSTWPPTPIFVVVVVVIVVVFPNSNTYWRHFHPPLLIMLLLKMLCIHVFCVDYIFWSVSIWRCTSGEVYVPFEITRMPGESYRRRLRSLLLYLCYVLRALINSLVFHLRLWRIPAACRNSTKSSHHLECICQCTVANTGWPPECSDGKRYKNNKCFHALRNRKESLSHSSKQTCTCKRRSIFVFARRFVITRNDLALKLMLQFSPMLWTWSVSNVSWC